MPKSKRVPSARCEFMPAGDLRKFKKPRKGDGILCTKHQTRDNDVGTTVKGVSKTLPSGQRRTGSIDASTQPTRRVESAKTYHEPGSLDQGRRVAHLHTERTAQLPVQNSHALPRRCVVFLPSTLSPWFGGPGHAKFVDPTLKQIEQQYFV